MKQRSAAKVTKMAGDERRPKRNDGGYRRNRKGGGNHGMASKQKKDVDMSSPVIQAFSTFQAELDRKHDKYERVVKLSRDVTIESKRIIFLLHRISGNENKEGILKEASERLEQVQSTMLSRIAEELESETVDIFLRAFTAGLQEYVEAVAFFVYLKAGHLVTQQQITDEYMQLKRSPVKGEEESTEDKIPSEQDPVKDTTDNMPTGTEDGAVSDPSSLTLNLPPLEYILGLADFTGELMRLCINSIGDGDLKLPYELVDFLRRVFDGFRLIGNQSGRELTRKVQTLRQSLSKVENVCYTLQVRGSEIPKHMLLDVLSTGEQDGEGFAHREVET